MSNEEYMGPLMKDNREPPDERKLVRSAGEGSEARRPASRTAHLELRRHILSNTPRTDALSNVLGMNMEVAYSQMQDLARQLERELSDAEEIVTGMALDHADHVQRLADLKQRPETEAEHRLREAMTFIEEWANWWSYALGVDDVLTSDDQDRIAHEMAESLGTRAREMVIDNRRFLANVPVDQTVDRVQQGTASESITRKATPSGEAAGATPAGGFKSLDDDAKSMLRDIEDYLEQFEDASCDGTYARPRPNKAMQLRMALRDFIGT